MPYKGGSKILGRIAQLQTQYKNSENDAERESCVKEANVISNLERANQSHRLQKYPILYKYDTVIKIDKIEKWYKKCLAYSNGPSKVIIIEEHKLFNELFQIWGWI